MSDSPSLRWLRNRINIWQRRTFLEFWQLDIQFRDKLESNAAAITTWSHGYSSGTIHFSVDAYNAMDEDEVDLLIVHELYHLFTAREDDALADMVGRDGEVYKSCSKPAELSADHFAKVLVKAYSRKGK